MNLAPVVLFTYKRLDTLVRTVETLKSNFLASKSQLIIFSDAAKGDQDYDAVLQVRSYLKSIVGFRHIEIHEAMENKGLANSIIDGVSHVLRTHDCIIVLEDDLASSRNFLDYMNYSLWYYRNNERIFSIAGYSRDMSNLVKDYDVYFTQRSSSWGWGTWKWVWEKIDWEVRDYQEFSASRMQKKLFNRMGSDMSTMLRKSQERRIDSWAIRWCYHQFKFDLYSVHPVKSKILNIGFAETASNTKEIKRRYYTELDSHEIVIFKLPMTPQVDEKVICEYIKPFSIRARIKYKLINLFRKISLCNKLFTIH